MNENTVYFTPYSNRLGFLFSFGFHESVLFVVDFVFLFFFFFCVSVYVCFLFLIQYLFFLNFNSYRKCVALNEYHHDQKEKKDRVN